MTRKKPVDLRLEAAKVFYFLQWFPGAKVIEAPRGMREAVLKYAKKGAA